MRLLLLFVAVPGAVAGAAVTFNLLPGLLLLLETVDVVVAADGAGAGDGDGDGAGAGAGANNPDVLDQGGAGDADADGDGLRDPDELALGTDPFDPDTDGDGLTDGLEFHLSTDPLDRDTDKDGLSDYEEVLVHGTYPRDPDSDGDGIGDAAEVAHGLDPLASDTADRTAASPGCGAWQRGEVYETAVPARVQLVYEMAIHAFRDAEEAAADLEGRMARLVGRELIRCEDTRRRLETGAAAAGAPGRRRLLVDGVDPAPPDVVANEACAYYTADNPATPAGSRCYVVRGHMTLYLRENAASSFASESSGRALKLLQTAMNQDAPSPFLGEEAGDLGADGVLGVRYMSGATDDEGGRVQGGAVLIHDDGGDAGAAGVNGVVQQAAEEAEGDAGGADALSPVGIALIAAGGAGLLVVALLAARLTRQRKHRPPAALSYVEFYDDEHDLDAKHHGDPRDGDGGEDARTDMNVTVDAASLHAASPAKEPRRDDGDDDDDEEDDSVFAGLDAPHRGRAAGTPGGDPAWVHARDGTDGVTAAAEQGYELPYDEGRHYSPAPASAASTCQRELPTYTASPDLESPRYTNPAHLVRDTSPGGRSGGHRVTDTVQL